MVSSFIARFEKSNHFKKLERCSKTLGTITMWIGIGMTSIGFPVQIYENWQKQQCGISVVIVLFAFSVYLIRIPYSISKRAWYLVPPDMIAFISIVIVAIQYIIYF